MSGSSSPGAVCSVRRESSEREAASSRRRHDPLDEPLRTAVSAAKKLINQTHVKTIVGAMCSSATLAIMPVTREAGVLHIVPLSYHPDITEKGQPYLFRTCITSNTNREFVDFMVEKAGIKRVALLGVNDDFGRGELGVFAKRFEALGANVVSTKFFRFEDRDFSIYLAKIKAAEPDGI